jgi:DNA polymerase
MCAVTAPSGGIPQISGTQAAALLLAWYREMGVDAVVAEEATDWLAHGEVRPGAGFSVPSPERSRPAASPPRATALLSVTRPQPPAATAQPALSIAVANPAPRRFPTTPPDEAVMAARTAARAATSLEALASTLSTFDGCGLKATAKSLCFFRGAERAALMVIGEAPGADEDKAGKPFVGRAGQMLDRMLAAIGVDEAGVHITNVVYWRPPGNRTPTPQETEVCRPFLERQIELVDPRVILMLGGAAAKHLTGVAEGIMRLRGTWRDIEIGGRTWPGMATLHPAYLLRTPASKRLAWRDLLAVKARILPREGGG